MCPSGLILHISSTLVVLAAFTCFGLILGGCQAAPERLPAQSAPDSPLPNDWAIGFSEGLGQVEINSKRGYIDLNGHLAIPATFQRAWEFSEGLAGVLVDANFGYIDSHGKLVIEPAFSFGHPFSQGLAAVRKGTKWGYIDKNGKWVIRPVYDGAYPFTEGLALVSTEGAWFFIDLKGQPASAHRFGFALPYYNGLAAVRERGDGGRWGFVNKRGEYEIKPQWIHAFPFLRDPNHAAVASRDESSNGLSYRFIRRDGSTAIGPLDGICLTFFSDALAMAIREDYGKQFDGGTRVGFLDPNGQWAISPTLRMATAFQEGLAGAATEEGWGIINKKGDFVVPPGSFDEVCPFSEGRARVRVGAQWGYIDKEGKWVWKPTQ